MAQSQCGKEALFEYVHDATSQLQNSKVVTRPP
ncbi:hypothetical protein ACDW_20110 [Acidovorax sp. DW039]|nr:hypothetical protein ACDW_20110 [Acidovorax sp. DW039]